MSKRSSNWHEKLRKEVLSNPEANCEYQAYKLQLELAEQLKKARKHGKLTQETVAERMKTQKPVIARLEAAGGSEKHSPSLKTIYKYATATNHELSIKLIPKKYACASVSSVKKQKISTSRKKPKTATKKLSKQPSA